ncbi:telomerase protein component 1-like isoform X1 [Pocillopora verrucosa]|uniref:telomerase protein component 1-like isoform X1 n=1 Tax=Pocillopora verrucosa TaxID=203993 RepID=UPI0033411678
MNKLTQTSEEEIQAVVDKCWQDIGNICGDETVKKSLSSPFDPRIRGWRVVRLFVSSTFADYHAEREVLVKKVVPELREWCEEKSINLIECDLRWGVPKDSTTETTIRTCLGEINRCAAEADGEPFFLNMLGERYGWIPDSSEISEEIQEEYQWIFPTSITHMEIIHAAYKMQNKNALFLLRDSEFLADLPPQMMKAFVDDHPLNKAHLKALKENLRQRYPGQVFDYSCQYGGIDESTGRSKVKLKGLEVFCQIVLEFFKSAINRLIPTVNQTLSVEEIELSMHNQFIELRGQLVLGRGEEITTVMNYVQHGTISDGSGSGRLPPLIVLGSSGSGKSALMAYCTLEIQNLGLPLFFHFVGACPGSTVPLKLLEKLVRWFNKGFSVEDIEQMSVKQLQQEIKEGVEELGKREEVFVIMIDAVNQLADVESQEHMDWLPSSFPHNVRCVISAVTDSRSVILLSDERRAPSPVPLHLPDLDTSVRQKIVERKLGEYKKKLDAEQMKLLIDSPGASNPLWLSLSCEELRVFGVFETITRHIVNLPSTLKELLKFIMNRLTAEDEDDNIQKVLGLLACSRGGLGETELQYLLSDDLSKAVAMMVWAQVRRTLKPFLRNVAGRREEERLDFFHASIQEVVLETILQDSEEKEKFHLKLADYFELHCKDKDRVIFMAPEQLKLAGKRKRLLEFLRNEERSGKPGQWKDRYYEDLRCDMRLLPGTAFSHNVHICRFCDMKRGAFGEHSCFICGRFTPWRNDMQAARVCHAHELPGPPNLVMCYLCRKPAFIDYAMVYLCALCENVAIKRCAMLVTD